MGNRKKLLAVTAAAAGASMVMVGVPEQALGTQSSTGLQPVVTGVVGPRGLAVSPDGSKVIYGATDGGIYSANASGVNKGIRKLGQVPADFGPAVDTSPHGVTYALTGGVEPGGELPPGAATLFKIRPGKSALPVANIGEYQKTDPDPYDLEDIPKDSNPFGVAALKDGTVLVADAAGNDLLRVWPNGRIKTVARLKPRMVPVPPGIPPEVGLPPAGAVIPSEAVATSVTVGADGYWYVGELRGVPATPGTSQIWRIKPGSTNALCDPANPYKGNCRRYADGFTSIVDLGGRPKWDKSLWVVELAKASWFALELGTGSPEGSLIKLSAKNVHGRPQGGNRTELAAGKLMTPGGVAVSKFGQVYVSSPVFGLGGVDKIVRVH